MDVASSTMTIYKDWLLPVTFIEHAQTAEYLLSWSRAVDKLKRDGWITEEEHNEFNELIDSRLKLLS